jgi:exonuclease VII large subunit
LSLPANITSVHVLDDFKAAVIKFVEEAGLALNEAESEVTKTIDWLQRDCQSHWTRVIRKKQEEVTMCKSALFRKQITPSANDQKASVVDEKKALQRAMAELEDAEKRLKAAKRWSVEMERQYALYKGAVQPLSAAVERDLPAAVARINRMIRALDEYLRTPSPALRELLDASREAIAAPSMRRTGDEQSDRAEQSS